MGDCSKAESGARPVAKVKKREVDIIGLRAAMGDHDVDDLALLIRYARIDDRIAGNVTQTLVEQEVFCVEDLHTFRKCLQLEGSGLKSVFKRVTAAKLDAALDELMAGPDDLAVPDPARSKFDPFDLVSNPSPAHGEDECLIPGTAPVEQMRVATPFSQLSIAASYVDSDDVAALGSPVLMIQHSLLLGRRPVDKPARSCHVDTTGRSCRRLRGSR